MTKVQIKAFMTVAKEKSFTRAANVLYISQPAISKSISTLEDELGFTLFLRKDNVLSLTAEGKLMYEFFVRSIDEFEMLLENIRASLSSNSLSLRLGCPDTWNPKFFYEKIRGFIAREHPDVELTVECGKLPDLISDLRSGKLDLALAHDFFSPTLYGISSATLTETGCGLIYSREYFGEVKDFSAFKGTDFLMYDKEIQKKLETVIREICRDRFAPTFRTTTTMANALFAVACGQGVMLFSEWDNIITNSAYGFLPLEEEMTVRMIYAADNKDPIVEMMIKELPAVFGKREN